MLEIKQILNLYVTLAKVRITFFYVFKIIIYHFYNNHISFYSPLKIIFIII